MIGKGRTKKASPDQSIGGGGLPSTARERLTAHESIPYVPWILRSVELAKYKLNSNGKLISGSNLYIDAFTEVFLSKNVGGLRPCDGNTPSCPYERMRSYVRLAAGWADEYVISMQKAEPAYRQSIYLAAELVKICDAIKSYDGHLGGIGWLLHSQDGHQPTHMAPFIDTLNQITQQMANNAACLKPPRADTEIWRTGFVLALGRAWRAVSDQQVTRNPYADDGFRDFLDAAFKTVLQITLDVHPAAFNFDFVVEAVNWDRAINRAFEIVRNQPDGYFDNPGGYWDSIRAHDAGAEWRHSMKKLHSRAVRGSETARRQLLLEQRLAEENGRSADLAFLADIAGASP